MARRGSATAMPARGSEPRTDMPRAAVSRDHVPGHGCAGHVVPGEGGAMKGKEATIVVGAALLAAAAAAAAVLTRAEAAPRTAQQQRPNVLILETDDQTMAEMEVLPNVRRLIGEQGVTFDNSFVSFSLC